MEVLHPSPAALLLPPPGDNVQPLPVWSSLPNSSHRLQLFPIAARMADLALPQTPPANTFFSPTAASPPAPQPVLTATYPSPALHVAIDVPSMELAPPPTVAPDLHRPPPPSVDRSAMLLPVGSTGTGGRPPWRASPVPVAPPPVAARAKPLREDPAPGHARVAHRKPPRGAASSHCNADVEEESQGFDTAPAPPATATRSSPLHLHGPQPPCLGSFAVVDAAAPAVFVGHDLTGGTSSCSLLGLSRPPPRHSAILRLPAGAGPSTGNGGKQPPLEVSPWRATPVSPPVAATATPRQDDRAGLSHRHRWPTPTPPWPPSAPRVRVAAHSNTDANEEEEEEEESEPLGTRRRQDSAYHRLGITDVEGQQPRHHVAALHVAAAGGGGMGGEGERQVPGAAGGGAQNQLKWYQNSAVLFLVVVLFYLLYHALLCGVSLLISVLPKDAQQKRGNWIWGFFWLFCVPFVAILYVKLCEFGAHIKRARMPAAVNQANMEQQQAEEDEAVRRRKAAALMMWVSAIARIVYLMVGNSWPMVTVAHGLGFIVEIIEVIVKFKVEGEINLGLPQV